MTESRQPVAGNADDKAKPSSEVDNGARDNGDDLDTLLKEFDDSNGDGSKGGEAEKPSKPQNTEPKPETTGDLSSKVQQLLDLEAERKKEDLQRRFDADMEKTVKAVRGDISANLASDKFVRAWVEATAEENPKLAQAWVDRNKNPKAFQRIVEKLSRDFAAEFVKRPDANATEDREVVTAAVRGASTKTPEDKAPDYKSMSDQDYAADVQKRYGYNPLA